MRDNSERTDRDDKIAVLFVDDEPKILKALGRILWGEPFQAIFAASGPEALELLTKKNIRVIICDLKMPQMDGLSLLKRVQSDYPDIIRLVLSAVADSESILESINSGNIYRYILKPWVEKELKLTIRQALDLFSLKLERRILLEKLEEQNQLLIKRVEERTKQVLAMERKAYLGQYAAQIVHNLNHPLQAICGGLDLSMLELSGVDADIGKLRDYLQGVKSSATDLGRIIADILDYSRGSLLTKTELVNINEIIKRELDFFNIDHFFRNHIEKQVNLSDELPQIRGRPFHMKQVFDNLIKNAIDAMEESAVKQLTVETEADLGTVTIKISDTGHGIPPEFHSLVFSPDFTTKPIGKGTGLGLASVKAMVESYSGSIYLNSVVGKGTTFTIQIPIAEA